MFCLARRHVLAGTGFSPLHLRERAARLCEPGEGLVVHTVASLLRPAASSDPTTASAEIVTGTCLNAGVFESGSTSRPTNTFASGKYIATLPGLMSVNGLASTPRI